MISSAAGLAVLAVAGALFFHRADPPAPILPPPEPIAVVTPPAPPPVKPTPAAVLPSVEPSGEPPVGEPAPSKPLPAAVANMGEERKPRPPKGPSEGRSRPSVAKATEESIPDGQGQLRISSSPPGNVTVAGVSRGETPVGLKLRSGAYTVELSLPSLQRRKVCQVKVLPDKTARLRYDAKEDRCAFDFL
jgi:hypothetical protein